MNYSDFYDIASYGNANWKGGYTQKEVACNAYEYLCTFEANKADGQPTEMMQELMRLLVEDGSEKCKEWLRQITREISE